MLPLVGSGALASAVLLSLNPAPKPALVHPVLGTASYGEQIARFGVPRGGHIHAGQDVFAPAGTPLLAIRDARVIDAGSGDARGNWIALYSRRRDETYVYFHMLAPSRRQVGERVRAGSRIGRVGCTGRCFGDHLHFEIRAGRGAYGRPRDPLPLLRRARAKRRTQPNVTPKRSQSPGTDSKSNSSP